MVFSDISNVSLSFSRRFLTNVDENDGWGVGRTGLTSQNSRTKLNRNKYNLLRNCTDIVAICLGRLSCSSSASVRLCFRPLEWNITLSVSRRANYTISRIIKFIWHTEKKTANPIRMVKCQMDYKNRDDKQWMRISLTLSSLIASVVYELCAVIC